MLQLNLIHFLFNLRIQDTQFYETMNIFRSNIVCTNQFAATLYSLYRDDVLECQLDGKPGR